MNNVASPEWGAMAGIGEDDAEEDPLAGYTCCTPLMAASNDGHKDVVDVLLAHNAEDVNETDGMGMNALMWASWGGHKDIVAVLLSHNADVNIKCYQGTTALGYAVKGAHKDTVDVLLSHYECTPLMAASHDGNKDVVDVLLAHNAEVVNETDEFGITALMWASI